MIKTRDVIQPSQEAFDEYVEALAEDYMDIEVPMNAAEWVPKLIKLIGELKSEYMRLYELDQVATDTINRWVNGENIAESTYYKMKNLSEENDRLREALRFYADEDIYTLTGEKFYTGHGDYTEETWYPIERDKGKIAHCALKGESK